MASAATLFSIQKLRHIPPQKRIRVVYLDPTIVVINKPGNLRSVPGNRRNNRASEQQEPTAGGEPNKKRKIDQRDQEEKNDTEDGVAEEGGNTVPCRLSAAEAWIRALERFRFSFDEEDSEPRKITDDEKETRPYLARLAAGTHVASNRGYLATIPRKYTTFCRYVERNRKRIFAGDESIDERNRMAKGMFLALGKRSNLLQQQPQATADEESAIGQLKLLLQQQSNHDGPPTTSSSSGNNSSSSTSTAVLGLYPVHRLDCATSGLLVVARNAAAAAVLSRTWRERDQVRKTYWARVGDWPLLSDNKQQEGEINLPLAPHQSQPYKWEVNHESGKPSRTLWRGGDSSSFDYVTLELTPVTGRTHQLRIHCAAVSSDGIVGDHWYGGKESTTSFSDIDGGRLYLHAYKLSFPHPSTAERMEFTADPDW